MGLYILFFFIPSVAFMAIVKLYFKYEYSWREFALQAVVTLGIVTGVFAAGSYGQTSDTQLVNGVVTKLDPQQKNCQSGWRRSTDSFCTEYRTRRVKTGQTCTTDSKGKRSCRDTYSTEYNYIYDWERRYFVRSDISQSYEIRRQDRQGVTVPARFAQINVGDPVTGSRSYTNYIQAASDSLFSESEPLEAVPIAYPSVRDYYIANRVIFTGHPVSGDVFKQWNASFAIMNSNLRKTGANAIVVITTDQPSFATALAQAWDSHNINDVVTVIGMSGDQISWVDTRSWSENSIVTVAIENDIQSLKTLDTVAINAIIEDAILANFKLQSMDKFEYLAEEIAPPKWAIILAAIMLLIVTPLLTYVFHKHDLM
jgi:hypothetical protein